MTTRPARPALDGSDPDHDTGMFEDAIGDLCDFTGVLGNDSADLHQVQSSLKLGDPGVLRNFGFAFSFAANALTCDLKDQAAANDPSAANPVVLGQRSPSLSTGAMNLRKITAALQLVFASGATFGLGNASTSYIYLYAIDNNPAQELAASANFLGAAGIVTTVAMSGAANSAIAVYSTVARNNVPYRAMARIKAPQAAAGAWTAGPTSVELWPWTDPPAAATVSVARRQAVQGGAVDANGAANWLSAGAGLTINLAATAAAVRLAFAAGYSDFVTDLTVDAANQFGALPASNVPYLYCDRVSATAIAGATTLVAPQEAKAFDRSVQLFARNPGANAATATTEDFGNTVVFAGNANLSTGTQIDGFNTIALDGTGDGIKYNSVTMGGDSWTVEAKLRSAALPGANVRHELMGTRDGATTNGWALYLYNNAGVTKVEFYASSGGGAYDIANGTVGTKTAWATATTYHFAVVRDALAGKYYVYVDGVKELEVASAVRVGGTSQLSFGYNMGANQWNGNLGWHRYLRAALYPAGTGFAAPAAPTIGDYKVHFFSKALMIMYEVTSASAVAGTNPGMTARNRLFVADADTGPAGVLATRQYAYLGRSASPWAAMSIGAVPNSFNTNLGTVPDQEPVLLGKCVIAQGGFVPGDVVPMGSINVTYAGPMKLGFRMRRNDISFHDGSQGVGTTDYAAGGYMWVIAANWVFSLVADRGY